MNEAPLPKPDALPASLPPRGLSRAQAAAFIGVSPSTYDRLVMDGIMPTPRTVYGRLIWCRLEVEAAFAELPARDRQTAQARDEWDGLE